MLQSLWVFTLSYALFLTLVAKHILLADDLKQKLVHLIGLFNQFLQQKMWEIHKVSCDRIQTYNLSIFNHYLGPRIMH